MKFASKKMVCLFAHPDDESFGPGGSIAYFSENCDVYLICVTSGDADKKFSDGKSGKELGQIRREELKTSAKILGVKKVYFLGFKDGSLNNNNYHEVAKSIKEKLDTIQPDTILTYSQNGVSGHLDHIAVSMISSYLFERLKYIRNILYYFEKDRIKKIIGSNYFVYFPEGISKKEADLVVDTKAYSKVKHDAMWAHESQRKDAIMIKTFFAKFPAEDYFKIKVKE